MKRGRAVWCIVGAMVVFAIYLGWPGDEFAYLRKFHPSERRVQGPVSTTLGLRMEKDAGVPQDWEVFEFRCDPKLVETALPDEAHGRNRALVFELPTGEMATFADNPSKVGSGEITCALVVDRVHRIPFLDRTWRTIKRWLGLG